MSLKLDGQCVTAACSEHLSRTHSVLWGQVFDVFEIEGREEAATWLTKQILGVLDFLSPETPGTTGMGK